MIAPEGRGRPARAAAPAGFSLVEVLVSLLVMSLLMIGLAQILGSSQVRHEADGTSGEQRQSARIVLSRLHQELRLAGYGAEPVGETFIAASPTSLSFAVDLDDGAAAGDCSAEAGDDGVELLEYRVDDGALQRRVRCWSGGAWSAETPFQTVAGDVTGESLFRYFDESGVEIPSNPTMSAPNRGRIVAIEIDLDLRAGGISDNGAPITFGVSSRVKIRNSDLS